METRNLGMANVMLVLVMLIGIFLVGFLIFGNTSTSPFGPRFSAKPAPDQVLQMLKDGNERFSGGKSGFQTWDPARISLASKSDQGFYAYATVLSCSDSRVPVELIFDAGIMDLFVVRVAGNVADTDEIGSIEYGLAHVKTPVLVILGHTRCGAVTAVSQAVGGHGHKRGAQHPGFEQLGMSPVGNSPAEFARAIREESDRWAKIVRERKLQLD